MRIGLWWTRLSGFIIGSPRNSLIILPPGNEEFPSIHVDREYVGSDRHEGAIIVQHLNLNINAGSHYFIDPLFHRAGFIEWRDAVGWPVR